MSENKLAMDSKTMQSILVATVVVGIGMISTMVSYAALIFSGSCPEYLGTGVALFLLAAGLMAIVFSLFSSYPGTFGSIQDIPVAIAAMIGLSLVELLPNASQAGIFSNLFVAVAISTVLTGICFVLLGYFKLGNLVRFIPYPVMGGFLAGTGWLLMKGGIQVTTSVKFSLAGISTFVTEVNPTQLACGLTFGIGLLILNRRFASNNYIMPGVIIVSFMLFALTTTFLGLSGETLSSNGWLIGPLPKTALWKTIAFPDLNLVDWSVILSQTGSISTIIILSAISFLLNESGVELVAGGDFEFNKDLYVTGGINIASGMLGAPSAFIFLGSTSLGTRMGARHRLFGILIGLLLLTIFFMGATLLSFFPNFIAGGLLVFLGLGLVLEWMVDARKTIPTIDLVIIGAIVLIIEFIGFLEGVGIGILASVLIFVFRYSSINVIKNIFDGSHLHSSKDRSIPDQRILEYNAEKMLILELDGFIFFGTANGLYEKVKLYASDSEKNLQFVIMDMHLVRGIDSSAIKSFQKLVQFLEKNEIELLIVRLSEDIQKMMESGGFSGKAYKQLQYFQDLDHSIEYCEDLIVNSEKQRMQKKESKDGLTNVDLMQASYQEMMAALDIQEMFESIVERLKPYLLEKTVPSGEYLYKQNEPCNHVFFIKRGQVTLSKKSHHDKTTRLRTLGPWTITGELGAYLDHLTPYDAVATKDAQIFLLTLEKRVQMESEQPTLASEVQKLIIIMLGNQLMKTSQMIDSVAS